ncbi:MAG: sulfotransferase [Nocardioidaceae bacterium]
MTLRLIGAGLPRTGTSSCARLPRHLPGAPAYHMSRSLRPPRARPTWVAAIEGTRRCGRLLPVRRRGRRAVLDLLARAGRGVPGRPVLLSTRGSAKVWHRSMDATVLPRTHEMLMRGDDDPMVPLCPGDLRRPLY